MRVRLGSGPVRPLAAACVAALAVLGGLPRPVRAQVKASEKASLSQTIDGTTLTLEYSRPSLRGRDLHDDLFGHQVPWGQAWTPGANRATTLSSDKGFRLEGVDVAAGRWSVWMVPDPAGWELVLDPRADLYHTAHPGPTDEQIRMPVEVREAAWSVETLSWTFPAVRRDGADLRMQWGTLAVELAVEVEPTVDVTLEPGEAAPYLGLWRLELDPSMGEIPPWETELRLDDGGVLTGELRFGPDVVVDAAFVPAAEHVFHPATMMGGEVTEVMEWSLVEFEMGDDGRAATFEMRGQRDELMIRGARVP